MTEVKANFCEGCPLRVENRQRPASAHGEYAISVHESGVITATIFRDRACGVSAVKLSDTVLGNELEQQAAYCDQPEEYSASTKTGLLGFIGIGNRTFRDCPAIQALRLDSRSASAVAERFITLEERN